MPLITLKDGKQLSFDESVTVYDVASAIGPGLAKAAIAGNVNDLVVDLSYKITSDVNLAIITDRDNAALEIVRHSCAHLLAQAVKQLFPSAQVTIGPVIENGFYYDFAFERPFTEDDVEKIESKMQDLVKQAIPIERSVMQRKDASKLFEDMGEEYKVKILESIPENDEISFYRQENFIDLCRGPHVPNTSKIKAFKLTKVAGAYWRGDSSNEMLQRIYGTAWLDKKQLKKYLHMLEEAQKRDHRKLGKKYDLFHLQEEAPGMVFWHKNGWIIFQEIKKYVRDRLEQVGYDEINTPQLVDKSLWEKSGHWDKFQENMFSVESEGRDYAIKPMNCPCHVQVYNQGLKSYRDLPYRLAEFGSCHRYEPSGALHGIMRVRNFIQDDAHIFCTEGQIQSEVADFNNLLFQVYEDFGFDEIQVKLSTRPEKRVGSDAVWDKAEDALKLALVAGNIEYELLPGEGAFYGPKIEFSLTDCMGRVWQCGTMQVDFSMPERLGAVYVDENGDKKTPVMLHRALLGSMERFIGILLENCAGSWPVWLAPVQAVIMGISDKHSDRVQEIGKLLKNYGIRVTQDLRNEKIGFKIREHTIQRIPYLLVIGDKELESQNVSVRTRDGEDLGSFSVRELSERVRDEIAQLGRNTKLVKAKKAEIA
ncbi:MAG: threonine--tRNA ligase [Francisellaceae bacterium]|jgi:threonyl-tRNA synthetase|nr:threonine--tRNA ligase [Francisellaceae bacterium]MBT6538281.1 threonine--tRNA ligase [Francisellaceae bacterium]